MYTPRGSIPLLSGMAMLELGSFSLTLTKIMPFSGEHTDVRWETLYYVIMAISNLLCFLCMLYGVGVVPCQLPNTRNKWVERSCKIFFAALTTGLTYMRQEFAIDKQKTAETRFRLVKSPLQDHEKWIADGTANILAYGLGICWLLASARVIWCSYQKEGTRSLRFKDDGESKKKM